MSSRISRKNRTDEELEIKGSGGITDLADNDMKWSWRVNNAELDFICEKGMDDETVYDDIMPHFKKGTHKVSFTDARKVITRLNELMDEYDKLKQ